MQKNKLTYVEKVKQNKTNFSRESEKLDEGANEKP
jgi:hypothetical protein